MVSGKTQKSEIVWSDEKPFGNNDQVWVKSAKNVKLIKTAFRCVSQGLMDPSMAKNNKIQI